MHDRPFDGRLGEVCIRQEGSTLRLIAIPNPDFIPEDLREDGSRLMQPTAKPEYRAMSNADYKQLLIDYKVTENPPESFDGFNPGRNSEAVNTKGSSGSMPTAPVVMTSPTTSASDKEKSNRLIEYYGFDSPAQLELKARKDLGIDDPAKLVPASERTTNFVRFVKENFQQLPPHYDDMDSTPVFVGPAPGSWPYKTIELYSNTDYGALMISRILADNDITPSSKRFTVRIQDGTAGGAINHIQFPDDFGAPGVNGYSHRFPGLEKIDYIAVVHHEFRHTRFFGRTKNIKPTIQDERNAVRFNSNPVRILNGNEPRYTYYYDDTKETINIITGQPDNGVLTFDKDLPQTLRPRGHSRAYKQ